MRRFSGWAFATALLGGALAAGPSTMAAPSDQDRAAREYFTDREVIDQHGNRLRFYSDVLQDRVVLLNVIYTNCTDACPLITQKLMQARRQLVPAIKDEVWFISISTDPERDTPEELQKFARKQQVEQRNWLFLTGAKSDIDLILRKLKQYSPNINAHSTGLLAGTTRERHQWVPVSPAVQPDGIALILRSLAETPPG